MLKTPIYSRTVEFQAFQWTGDLDGIPADAKELFDVIEVKEDKSLYIDRSTWAVRLYCRVALGGWFCWDKYTQIRYWLEDEEFHKIFKLVIKDFFDKIRYAEAKHEEFYKKSPDKPKYCTPYSEIITFLTFLSQRSTPATYKVFNREWPRINPRKGITKCAVRHLLLITVECERAGLITSSIQKRTRKGVVSTKRAFSITTKGIEALAREATNNINAKLMSQVTTA